MVQWSLMPTRRGAVVYAEASVAAAVPNLRCLLLHHAHMLARLWGSPPCPLLFMPATTSSFSPRCNCCCCALSDAPCPVKVRVLPAVLTPAAAHAALILLPPSLLLGLLVVLPMLAALRRQWYSSMMHSSSTCACEAAASS